MFGFCGASRTGKSTLAKLISEGLGYHYHTFNTAEIMREKGYNLVDPALTFETRIEAQEAYLDHYEAVVATLPRPTLTDRTPLCLAGYLLSEIRMHDHAEHGERVLAFVERAVFLTDKHFHTVFICRPLDFYEEAAGKAPANLGYQWHHQLVCEGLAEQCRFIDVGTLHATDLETRCEAVTKTIVDAMVRMKDDRSALTHH